MRLILKNANYKIAFLLIVFSGFFISQIPSHASLPLPLKNGELSLKMGINFYNFKYMPVYFSTIISFVLYFLSRKNKLKYIPRHLYMPLIFCIYYLASQITYISSPSALIVQILNLMIIYVVVYSLKSLSISEVKRICISFLNISLLLLTVECIWRVSHPVIIPPEKMEESWFYIFKFSSIMYQDSNFTAIQLLVMFFFALYLEKVFGYKLIWQKSIYVLLIVLSFSRSAWISLILGLIFIKFFFRPSFSRIVVGGIIGGCAIVYIFILVALDASFATKIDFFEITLRYLNSSPEFIPLMFGVGIGNSDKIIGTMSAHNILLIHLLDMGVIGLIIATGMFIQLWRRIPYSCYVIFPFIIAGMSAFQSAYTYLMAIVGIMYVVSIKNHNNIKNEKAYSILCR